MPDLYVHRRPFAPLAVLAAVVLAQILLLAFQIKRDNRETLIRYWAAELITPAERAGTWTFSKIGGVWTGYVGLHNAHKQNALLRDEVDRLELRNRELETQSAEAQRLAILLNFREVHPEASMLAAQVIGASSDAASHTLFINRGERDRVRRNMGVITPQGVVGKIVEVFPSAAQVLLIDDRESGVGALFAGTRTHGVVKGSGDPEPHMEYVVNDENVHRGEEILTSGEDRIFPKGLLVGTVESANPGNPFQIIRVQPAARLDRLEDVLILMNQQELAPKGGVAPPELPAQASIATPAAPEKNSATTAANSAKPNATSSGAGAARSASSPTKPTPSKPAGPQR
ncbi:MAG: rod shape-determining protein MreC [Candidatus Acidiferrales bacterium]